MRPAVVVTCEHGGNRVPAAYRELFAGAGRALASHRGWDPGALVLARRIARALDAPLLAARTTRLLADLNRSEGRAGLFSEWSRSLSPREREDVLSRWWRPHRAAVEAEVRARSSARRPVLHLGVHSFTPRWNGRPRAVDVGFLHDPARPLERAFAQAWIRALRARRDDLRLRRNQPYRGDADGLTTTLRGRLAERRYLGIELEISQRFPLGQAEPWRRLRHDLVRSLEQTLEPERVATWFPDGAGPARRGRRRGRRG